MKMSAWDSMKGWKGALGQLVLVPGMLRELEHRQESRLNAMVELFRAKREADPVATLLVIGTTANSYRHLPQLTKPDEMVPEKPFTACWAAAKAVQAGRNSTMVEVEPMRPVEACTVVVLCDLERVEVNGLFVGTDCIVLGSPVGFVASIAPGYRVRAMLNRREP